MTKNGFVHLHVHTAYSLSEGAIQIPHLADLASEYNMPAIAITDTDNLFGALEFSQYCWDKGIQPIIGCQIGLNGRKDRFDHYITDPVVLLAQTETGLHNLQTLSSLGFMNADDSEARISIDTMCRYAEGLFLLTGGTRGPIFRFLHDSQEDEAVRWLEHLMMPFKGRIGIEINRHNLPVESYIEPGLISLADRFSLPLVATNDCFFPTADMYESHDALMCLAQSCTMADKDRWRVTPNHWFKPPQAMMELFHDLPEACSNTVAIAKISAVRVQTRAPMLPVFPKINKGETEVRTLFNMANEGLKRRLQRQNLTNEQQEPYQRRLTYELDVIGNMGFAGYFLIVADFIQWAKSHKIPVGPGRGSGAGSLVAWALTITDLDPLAFNLLFERFLNPERISMPDFDIDFCQDRRDEVIEYVRTEYGHDRVAHIITFGKLQARAAIRDVGRVLGLPFFMVNKVAELIPNNPTNPVTLQRAIQDEPRLQEMRDSDESVRRLLEIACQLEGLYRHASTHAAGVVIGDKPLIDLVPLYRDPRSEMLVTQYNMKYVEQVGLVKFDFLGLATLTVLQRCVDILEKLGVQIDLANISLDDPATFDMLSKGDTGGVFQFEGAGMRDVLRQMCPTRLEDLIAAVALYRPGPMANIPDYCRRKRGEAWVPPHEDLRDILQETYGIMVYQEQVMQIAQKMAGYSLSAADVLRRAMGKKIRAEMNRQREIFTVGAIKNGYTTQKAHEVFDLMAKFANYGFNKSHAAAYALVSYQTAWMKANHPVPFLAACMSLAREKTDKLSVLHQEAHRMGIHVLPPDINASDADFKVEAQSDGSLAIRYALAAIKRVGLLAMQEVVRIRGHKSFRDLHDFSSRIDPHFLNKMQIENLAKAGAFDSLNPDRHRIFASSELILRRATTNAEQKKQGQIGLFSGQAKSAIKETFALKPCLPWTEYDRLKQEAEAVGFHLTGHPLDSYIPLLKRLGTTNLAQLDAAAHAGIQRIKLAGCIVDKKERPTRKGSKMAWVRISDTTGSCEVAFFSEVLGRSRELLITGKAVLVTADLKFDGEMLRVTAQDACDLDEATGHIDTITRVWISTKSCLDEMHKTLSDVRGGKGKIILLSQLANSRNAHIPLPGCYAITPRIIQNIKALEGVVRVEHY